MLDQILRDEWTKALAAFDCATGTPDRQTWPAEVRERYEQAEQSTGITEKTSAADRYGLLAWCQWYAIDPQRASRVRLVLRQPEEASK